MTKEEIQRRLRRYRALGLLIGAMIQDPIERESRWFQLGRTCGRPIREFLLDVDPNEDPSLYLQAIQALEGLREEQMWVRSLQNGQGAPFSARWQ